MPANRTNLLGVSLVTVALALLGFAAAAQAQIFTVTNLGDTGVTGDGSLRGEILAANAAPGADRIEFAAGLSGLLLISATGFVIEESVEVIGPGAGQITIEQIAPNHRVFQVKLKAPGAVTLSGLTIRGGETEGSGGDIENVLGPSSALTVADCRVIYGYAAEKGGAIDSVGEPLTVRSSVIEENEAGNSGGGIWAGGSAPLLIEGSTVAANISGSSGGGLYGGNESGYGTVISASTFVGNQALEAGGGASLSVNAGATLRVSDSTFVGNTSGTWGGALAFSSGGSVTIEGATITGNEAAATFAGAGGLEALGPNPPQLIDTIVAGNKEPHTMTPDLHGSWDAAFSLIGSTAGATLAESVPGSVLIGIDPQLAPLADNGGPTETMALPPTSPAVNKGGGSLAVDQRGDVRPSIYPGVPLASAPGANGADIGAYELQAPAVSQPPSSTSKLLPPTARKQSKRPPRVRVSCPKSAAPAGCHFKLQVFSAKPRATKGRRAHPSKPVAESLVASVNLRPGKSAEPTLTPKPRFAAKLTAAKTLLVREVATIGGKSRTIFRRLRVVR